MEISVLEMVHESAKDMREIGAISAVTMKEYDALCLPEVQELSPVQIKEIRKREKVSQPIFAKFLNISASTIKHWETGEKHPSAVSLKLLDLVARKGLMVLA